MAEAYERHGGGSDHGIVTSVRRFKGERMAADCYFYGEAANKVPTKKPALAPAPPPDGSVRREAVGDVPFCRDPDPGAPDDALTLAQLDALSASVFGGGGDSRLTLRAAKAKRAR